MSENVTMLDKRSWAEFQTSGLLWFVNRTLHLFGWAIALETDDVTGEILSCYPAHCKFRGFHPDTEDEGYKNVTNHLMNNMERIQKDVE